MDITCPTLFQIDLSTPRKAVAAATDDSTVRGGGARRAGGPARGWGGGSALRAGEQGCAGALGECVGFDLVSVRLPARIRVLPSHRLGCRLGLRAEILLVDHAVVIHDEGHDARRSILRGKCDRGEPAAGPGFRVLARSHRSEDQCGLVELSDLEIDTAISDLLSSLGRERLGLHDEYSARLNPSRFQDRVFYIHGALRGK
jgi:hypothetical protein